MFTYAATPANLYRKETLMFTYTATIGRNVGATPMSDLDWALFQSNVLDIMIVAGRRHVDTSDPDVWAVESWTSGAGGWHGVREESVHFQLRSAEAIDPYVVWFMIDGLADQARQFKQDAIAFSSGESILIESAARCHANHTVDCGV